ncbi:unnamed protein product [Heligmosomoides polygyrus]|uniref:Glutamine synthetase n=1 Tax=Heligmosomoides polygyrus TaxID=6339 RepID=A0A183GQ25_HELPZ|nr:unnamed protein product [Heligmosomoides polygyrus]
MFLLHPGVFNAVVVPHPAVDVAGVVGGDQPINQGAGQAPHVVGEPHFGADQQGMGIREVISEMMEHLSEVENHYLNLHAVLIPDGEPVSANAVIEPYAFQLMDNIEGLEERVVQNYRAYLSETYACFACEEGMMDAFLRALFEMHARFVFLLDVHIDARIRAA